MRKLLLASIVTAFILPMGASRADNSLTTNKLTLDAETNDGHKCKIDAWAEDTGYCGLIGEVEIDGEKYDVTGTGLVGGGAHIGVLGGNGGDCVGFINQQTLMANERFLAFVNPLGDSGVEAVCKNTHDDPHLDRYATAAESKKLQVKLDSDTQN